MGENRDSTYSCCKLCGSDANRGQGIVLGEGWTKSWASPFSLCYSCIDSEHGVRVGSSLIVPDEMGLFATKHFEPDAFIVPYCGEEISVAQLRERYGINSSPCGAFLREGYSVDAPDSYLHGLGRYANDRFPYSTLTDNNSYIANFLVGPPEDPERVAWPGLYARVAISAGEEITNFYGKAYWDAWKDRIK